MYIYNDRDWVLLEKKARKGSRKKAITRNKKTGGVKLNG